MQAAMTDDILLPFSPQCRTARFVQREKRFRVEARLDGRQVWAHTNNSGSMLGLLRPDMEILLSPAANPARKLPYTLELVSPWGEWIGVNTLTPNRLLKKVWEQGLIAELRQYVTYKAEARVGHSRLDARLDGPKGTFWIEAKNVTLVEDGVACFPDAVTLRGQKHLEELILLAGQGARVGCFYLVQRPDGECFGPADFIDPEFARLFYLAVQAGVEMLPFEARVSPRGIGLGKRLQVVTGT
ncbi:sugar fermentation stimulation protein [Desulfoplanes formicivorans]|uniref:Sugar fermentation stimulation protein homolog n=2 Tax=Desulfoplanes formicivorans TaxID=1592317 RepID=A0A194AJK5_9BACT|nr:sugar fermentation stimulation protein [Desulfoplanes formicivorans]